MWRLEETAYKLERTTSLLESPKCRLEVGEGALLAKVFLEGRHAGYVIRGPVKYAVDTVLETPEGAVGMPVKREGEHMFMYLRHPPPEVELTPVVNEEFLREARDLCERLFKRSECKPWGGHIVVFPARGGFEVLVVKGDKLTYTSSQRVFVSSISGEKEVLVEKAGGLVIIRKGDSVLVSHR